MNGMRWFAGLVLIASLNPDAHAQGASPNPETTNTSGTSSGVNRSGNPDLSAAQQEAEEQTAAYEAITAASNAEAAMYEAQLAALKLKYGGVAGQTTLDGGVTFADDKAGKPEAMLLVNRSATAVAEDIYTQLRSTINSRPGRDLLILEDRSDLSLDAAILFDLQASQADTALDAAVDQFDYAKQQDPRDEVKDEERSTGSNRSGIPIAGAVVDSLAKLGSYFQSTYTFGNVTIEDFQSSAIAYALAGKITSNRKPCKPQTGDRSEGTSDKDGTRSQSEPNSMRCADEFTGRVLISNLRLVSGIDEINTRLNELSKKYIQVLGEQAISRVRVAALTQAGKTLPASHYTSADTSAQKAMELYTALVTLVTAAPQGDTESFVVRVARQKKTSEFLKESNPIILMVSGKAAGQYYAKKSLWTFLGGPPIYTAGAVTASYILLDHSTGEVLVSGTAARHGGYQSIRKVQGMFDGKADGQ